MSKYNHAEAFCLMRYETKDGTEIEYIWNSRDGVTPFTITSNKTGKAMYHVKWQNDMCVPDFKPVEGQRIFIDITPDNARMIAAEQVRKYWDSDLTPMKEMFNTEEEAIESLIDTYLDPPGQPYLYP